MVDTIMEEGKLLDGVNFRLIILIFKVGFTKNLENLCLITLLNVTYKIMAKVLQLRLQLQLMKIIDSN